MRWLALHIDTDPGGLDMAAAMLSALGIDGVSIEDETEFRDFLEENRRAWDYVDEDLSRRMAGRSRITFYLPADEEGFSKLAQVRIALSRLKESLGGKPPLLTLEETDDQDWENGWRQYYKPMEVGERLLVVPEWEQAEAAGRIPVVLDPGLAFGTGSHASTRLCLIALEKCIHGGERVLDLGCGSGILSIASLRLGAASAVAVDIDRTCRDVACRNAALNGIGPEAYTVRTGDVLEDATLRAELGGGYDVVLANIVADVILGLAPLVRDFMRPGGVFLCSGIIDSRAEEVARGLRRAGLDAAERREESGWVSFTCR